jgi:hypothetical protein
MRPPPLSRKRAEPAGCCRVPAACPARLGCRRGRRPGRAGVAQVRRPGQLVRVHADRPPGAAALGRGHRAGVRGTLDGVGAFPSGRTTPAVPPPAGPSGHGGRWSRSGSGRPGCAPRLRARTARGSSSACRARCDRAGPGCAPRSHPRRGHSRAVRAVRGGRWSLGLLVDVHPRAGCPACPARPVDAQGLVLMC